LSWRYVALTSAALALALLPPILGLAEYARSAATWRYGDKFPFRVWTLGGALPLRLTVGAALAWLVARLCWPRLSRQIWLNPQHRLHLALWLALVPLMLWIMSRWFDVFHVRYILLATPAAALLAGAAFARLPSSARAVAVTLPLLALLGPRLFQPRAVEDFRHAAEVISDLSLYDNSPLLVPSWFVEAHVDDGAALYRARPALYGHLFAYPVPNEVHPLPVWYSEQHAGPAIARLLDGPLRDRKRLLVGPTPWTAWFRREFEQRGWRVTFHLAWYGVVIAECER
jgi:hypothetical protein